MLNFHKVLVCIIVKEMNSYSLSMLINLYALYYCAKRYYTMEYKSLLLIRSGYYIYSITI